MPRNKLTACDIDDTGYFTFEIVATGESIRVPACRLPEYAAEFFQACEYAGRKLDREAKRQSIAAFKLARILNHPLSTDGDSTNGDETI